MRPLHVDEDDEFSRRRRGRSWSGLWVGLVVLLAAAFGVAQGWSRISSWLGDDPANHPVEPFVRAGQDALRLDHQAAYREAATHFTKALAFDEHDARALSGLSRAHALMAQQRYFEASDLEAGATAEPTRRVAAAALREQATEHIEQARVHAEAAIRHASGDGDVEIALSDALRLSGDFALAESRLARGRTLASAPSAEASRVEALLTADQARNIALARPAAERAVTEDPGLIRARLLLARVQLAEGDIAEAQTQLRAVLDRVADHPLALSMQAAISEGTLPAASAPTSDGSSAAAAQVTPTEPAAQPLAAEPPARLAAPGTHAPAPASTESASSAGSRGYDALVREGEQRLENGDIRRARVLFEQALGERAGGSEAIAGLGFVMIAEGNVRGAVTQLQRAVERGSSDALIGLGDAFRRLHEREQALRSYERYLEQSPSGPRASIARRQAERLRAELGTHRDAPVPERTPSSDAPNDSDPPEPSQDSAEAPNPDTASSEAP